MEGLGILPGRVVRFFLPSLQGAAHGLEHDWKFRAYPLYIGLLEQTAMYLVHSFYPAPDDPKPA